MAVARSVLLISSDFLGILFRLLHDEPGTSIFRPLPVESLPRDTSKHL